MSEIAMSEQEKTIITEYARIKKVDSAILLRRGIDAVISEALVEQIRLDAEAKNVSPDVVALFESPDYERVIIQAKYKGIIPDSLIEHLKAR